MISLKIHFPTLRWLIRCSKGCRSTEPNPNERTSPQTTDLPHHIDPTKRRVPSMERGSPVPKGYQGTCFDGTRPTRQAYTRQTVPWTREASPGNTGALSLVPSRPSVTQGALNGTGQGYHPRGEQDGSCCLGAKCRHRHTSNTVCAMSYICSLSPTCGER